MSKYLDLVKICKNKENYKYLDQAKSRAGLRACGVDCDQAVDSAWVTHGKSGHEEDLNHDYRIILVINLFCFVDIVVFIGPRSDHSLPMSFTD